MVWYSHLFENFPQFVVIYIVKGFSVVSEAEVDVFLEFPYFSYDLMDHRQSGSFHNPLILIHQRAERMKPQSQKTSQT